MSAVFEVRTDLFTSTLQRISGEKSATTVFKVQRCLCTEQKYKEYIFHLIGIFFNVWAHLSCEVYVARNGNEERIWLSCCLSYLTERAPRHENVWGSLW